MAVEVVQTYVHLVSGLTKVARMRAAEAARAVLAQAGLQDVAADAGERVAKLAQEVLDASRANRDLLEKLITAEVDKAATRLGFAHADDLERLRTEVADLRQTIEHQETSSAAGVKVSPAAEPPHTTSPARKAAKKAATKRASAKKTAAKTANANPPGGDW